MALIKLNDAWYEMIDSESPSTVQFNNVGMATASITFVIGQRSIIPFINDVLGSARLANNSYVRRVIPASHPIFPWLYAYKITSVKGVAQTGENSAILIKADTTYKSIDTENPPFTGSYGAYKMVVEFRSREYGVFTDEQLDKFKVDVDYGMPIRQNFQNFWGERIETYTERYEYVRYTSYKMTPKVEFLTYGGGNFWCKRGEIPAGVVAGAEEFAIPMENGGNNNMRIVMSDFDWNWFMVPFEMCVNNKVWQESYSKLNQELLYNLFAPGSMLLKEVVVRKWDPYYPFLNVDLTNQSSVYDYFTEYNKNIYADVTFKISLFDSQDTVKKRVNPNTYTALTCKNINSLFNRICDNRTRSWIYIESAPAVPQFDINGNIIDWRPNPQGTPIYWSTPYGRLFTYQEGP